MVDECLLQRMKRAVGGKALNRGDAGAILHDRQCQAGVNTPAVDQDRAGAALAMVAAFLRAGQAEAVAQRIEQRRPRRDGQLRRRAIDIKRDGNCGRLGDRFSRTGPRGGLAHEKSDLSVLAPRPTASYRLSERNWKTRRAHVCLVRMRRFASNRMLAAASAASG